MSQDTKISHALILAAGRGERMRPLTDSTPKPLLFVGGKRLIEYHLERLAAAGIREVVINTSHLAEQVPAALGDGASWGVHIRYSHEGPMALETGGGILHALPLLGTDPFIVVNGDIFCDLDFSTLPQNPDLAHLVVVDNPSQHPQGDFVLRGSRLYDESTPRLTFAGIGVYRPELLARLTPGKFSIVPTLRAAMRAGRIGGQHHHGIWLDVGTPERLTELATILP
ncbi:MAG TPA: nucleotidyltransferase family protein [Rudaea sp.]|jgi:MurNAc alpha-1-phosphate uridylyltransferase|uniref:N-acetylmuramate alpha-1-phosphate uridylyltransferase MurU n=1 Tax=Rudaea sp. TaxID=2136325 RepID=UPI002F93290B